MLENLAEQSEKHQVVIYLYCLMTNHVHLLAETPLGNLDRFMGGLLTSYTVYFNLRHQRAGHVMQGRYHAQLVSGDTYLLNLSRYIHLNPIKVVYWSDKTIEQKLEFLHQFGWSSYRAYTGLAKPESWLQRGPILNLVPPNGRMPQESSYQQFVDSGVASNDTEFRDLLKAQPFALGPESFVEDMKRRCQETIGQHLRKEDVSFRAQRTRTDPERVKAEVIQLIGGDASLITKRRIGNHERALLCAALERFSGLTQREIAGHIGVTSGAAVSSAIKRYGHSEPVIAGLQRLNLIFKG